MVAKRKNRISMLLLILCSIGLVFTYLTINVDPRFYDFAMMLRRPKMIGMILAAFCIGTASIAFQSVINNYIVTPCLLGMNSLYILTNTVVAFTLGTYHPMFMNANVSFITNVVIMSVAATIIYGFMFRVTNYNVLYVLLSGTVMATLFGSISSSLIRMIDPNEYLTLQANLIAGFNNVNSDIIVMAVAMIVATIVLVYRDIKLLDVITLGKNQAINLGVDYDKTISRILLAVAIFISIATALVGPISFLGLILANVARQMFLTFKHSYLMMGSFLVGVVILLFGQTLIEHVFNFSTVISVFINLFGGGYFLYLIVKNKGA
ncbi:MAG: CRISPR-associated protein Cas5 [Epulopiscium sp. Nele67-Bin002]|nr:MAG: CRISPR-associated protein Cas5 [Epulopiscium sp. Nele67-Bin002]